MAAARYKAFISYSHRDERWARWLQRALERYRVPPRLVGKNGAHGTIPARLRPVFRDRVDLSSASDLENQILRELHESETLIVICSPSSAESHWVNEEIRDYRQMGRGDRILALVVDGDPLAEDPSEACFPPALLESKDGKGHEPLAADVRRYADGKRLSLLKIVAGMLGIRLDELRRRDAQRRMQRRIVQGLVVFGLVAVISSLGWNVETKRQAAQLQRSNTEELLQFMLGELDELDPVVGLENLDATDDHLLHSAAKPDLAGLNPEELLKQAKEWRQEGLESKWNGDLSEAMDAHDKSRAALLELHQREGNTPRVLFELGQAEFYVGEIHMVTGEIDEAEQHWSHYGAMTRRLLNSDPRNPVYVMELSYTIANLGALELMKTSPDIDRSLELLQIGIRYAQMALLLDPGNQDYREAQFTQRSWLADAWLEKCALGNALTVRQLTVELRKDLVSEYPKDTHLVRELAFSLSGLAGVQQMIGLNSFARASYEESVALLRKLHEEEPDNGYIEWEVLYRSTRLARLLYTVGETREAADIVVSIAPRVSELSASDVTSDKFIALEAARYKVDYGLALISQGRRDEGEAQLAAAVEDMSAQIQAHPDFRDGFNQLALASFEYWKVFGDVPGEIVGSQLAGLQTKEKEPGSCYLASLGARLAVMNGAREQASKLTDYVFSKGYYQADFVSFCEQYDLCVNP